MQWRWSFLILADCVVLCCAKWNCHTQEHRRHSLLSCSISLMTVFLLFYLTQSPKCISYTSTGVKKSLGTLLAVMVNFHKLVQTFHHMLHSTFSIGFTSFGLVVQTLHRCFLNEPSVLSFLQGLNYTIQRKKTTLIHSFTTKLSLSPSLSLACFFVLTAFTRLRLTVVELNSRCRCCAA